MKANSIGIRKAVVARLGGELVIFLDGDTENLREGNILGLTYFMEKYCYEDYLADFQEREHYLRCAYLLDDRVADLESRLKELKGLLRELLYGEPLVILPVERPLKTLIDDGSSHEAPNASD